MPGVPEKKSRLVVLGSGFGAFRFLKGIDTSRYDVYAVSPRNYFLFTPLLPSTAVGTIEFRSIVEPVRLARDTTYEEIGDAMDQAAKTNLKGILATTNEQLVSSDFIGNPYSCIYDKLAGIGLNSRFYKLIAWYDNEMGYSHRVVDLLEHMASKE